MMYEELMDYIMAYQDILTMANRVIEIWKNEYLKVSNELEQVKAERDTFLKEKAEREKGCDFCNAEYAVMSGSRMNSDLIHKGCAAKFCPNCGKRLVSEE